MNKPIIGITTAWSVETWNDSIESGGYNYAGRPYIEAVIEAGGTPILIPQMPHNDIDLLIGMIDGFLFTGGGDAKRFSKESMPSLREQQPNRYDFESILMKSVLESDKPILGICRGFQMLIEVFGGRLSDEVIDGHKQNLPGSDPWHKVNLIDESLLNQIVKENDWKVNSFHVQKVEEVPEGFYATAISEDGVIEAIERRGDQFIVGTQFHPEELLWGDARASAIFTAFIEKSSINRR
ncbi:MAG: type 1 glutamine amidotransferase [Dethiosulfatibacter sp.]|nr:type 1 glutamine amidotransferase [Dethiosulfatibacter sp.]